VLTFEHLDAQSELDPVSCLRRYTGLIDFECRHCMQTDAVS